MRDSSRTTLLMGVILLMVSCASLADMRGNVVCGSVPPNEAISVVWDNGAGRWFGCGPVQCLLAGEREKSGALDLVSNEDETIYACPVQYEIRRSDGIVLVSAELYRHYVDMESYEHDPRDRIPGTPGNLTRNPGGSAARPAFAAAGSFGDNSSRFANDGDCDDTRFVGDCGSTADASDEHIGRDSADCEALYRQGRIQWRNEPAAAYGDGAYGDDSGEFAFDDECDDKRFTGPAEWYYHWPAGDYNYKDATDCGRLLREGRIQWR